MAENKIDAGILRGAIERSWCAHTSQEPEKWSALNPAGGQCVPTSLVVHDFFGGRIIRLDLSKSANHKLAEICSHYFNEVDGKWIDFSAEQFGRHYSEVQELFKNPALVSERQGKDLLKIKDVRDRYLLLRLAVARDLSGCNSLFDDSIYRKCLLLAFQSDCEKLKFGCVVTHDECQVAAGSNLKSGVSLDLSFPVPKCDFYIAGVSENGLIDTENKPPAFLDSIGLFLARGGRSVFVPVGNEWRKI